MKTIIQRINRDNSRDIIFESETFLSFQNGNLIMDKDMIYYEVKGGTFLIEEQTMYYVVWNSHIL